MNWFLILVRAVSGYMLLNCLLFLSAIAMNFYMRYKDGNRIIPLNYPEEMTAKELKEELLTTLVAPIVALFLTIPAFTYISAAFMAKRLKEKRRKKCLL